MEAYFIFGILSLVSIIKLTSSEADFPCKTPLNEDVKSDLKYRIFMELWKNFEGENGENYCSKVPCTIVVPHDSAFMAMSPPSWRRLSADEFTSRLNNKRSNMDFVESALRAGSSSFQLALTGDLEKKGQDAIVDATISKPAFALSSVGKEYIYVWKSAFDGETVVNGAKVNEIAINIDSTTEENCLIFVASEFAYPHNGTMSIGDKASKLFANV